EWRALAINPSLTFDEQFDRAKKFSTRPFDDFSADSIMSALKLVKEEVQEGMANVIDDVRNGRAQILYIDGIAYAVFVRGAENAAEGFVQKYVEIPIDLIRTLSGEMTAQEFLFESAEGYIPVVILGYAGAMKEAIITKSFAPLKARILFRS